MAKPWTREESRAVFSGVGSYGWAWMVAQSGGRSLAAISSKIRRLCGSGARRGALSLHAVAVVTGYNRTQLRRAASALNQKWRRMGPRGAHIITDEQFLEIIDWLQHDFWSKRKRLYGCVWCATERREHKALGLCGVCFFAYRRRCRDLGLPVTRAGQGRLLQDIERLACDLTAAHARFLEEAKSLHARGLALSPGLLDWLVTAYEQESGE
jgi:hypothetical protein